MDLSDLPKEGDIILCRYGDDRRNRFTPFKLRPVLVVGIEYDPVLKMPLLNVVPITTKHGTHDRFEIKILDWMEKWRPAEGTKNYVIWKGGLKLPLDKIFFPKMDDSGKQPILGCISTRAYEDIELHRAIADIDPNNSILTQYIISPASIIKCVPKAMRNRQPEGTRHHRGMTGRPKYLRARKPKKEPKP